MTRVGSKGPPPGASLNMFMWLHFPIRAKFGRRESLATGAKWAAQIVHRRSK